MYDKYMSFIQAALGTIALLASIFVIVALVANFWESVIKADQQDTDVCEESVYCLGEDIYDVDGKELLINNDVLYDIESKFIWYSSRTLGNYRVHDSSSLTPEILEHRAGKDVVVVERCIGYVTDGNSGDGVVINTESKNNFISFKGVSQEFKTGTVFVTYFVYANNNAADDFERYDFILTRDYEV